MQVRGVEEEMQRGEKEREGGRRDGWRERGREGWREEEREIWGKNKGGMKVCPRERSIGGSGPS